MGISLDPPGLARRSPDYIGARELSSLRPLPGFVSNTFQGYNGGQNTVIARGFQYAVFVRNDNRAVVAQRALGTKNWLAVTDLSPLLGAQIQDGHNYYSMAVDSTGHIHIAGNQHNSPINYVISNSPDSITAFTRQSALTGVNESGMTYPQFLNVGSRLAYFYRHGFSGDGDYVGKIYTPATTTWADLPTIIDGTITSESSYTSLPMLSQDGTKIGLAFNWRSTGFADSNSDECYIQTTDLVNLTNWTDIAGTPVTLPLEHVTSPVIFPTAPTGSGFLNTGNLDFDLKGHPHIAFLFYDTNGYSNIKHLYWDGSAWQNEFVTFGTRTMALNVGIVDGSVGRPGVVCTDKGETYILWRTSGDGCRGTIRVIDVTTPGSPVEFSVSNLDIGYQELLWFDAPTVRSLGRLDMLITPQPFSQQGQGDYGDAVNWGAQWGGVLTLDARRLRQLSASQSTRSKQRTVASMSSTQSVSTTAQALTDVSNTPVLSVPPTWAADGRVVVARLRGVMSKATGGSGTWALTQRDRLGGAITTLGSYTVTSATSAYYGVASALPFETPWLPLDLSTLSQGGTLQIRGLSSDGNTATLASVTVEVAMLENPDGTLLGVSTPPARVFAAPAEDSAVAAVTTGTLFLDWDAGQISSVDGAPVLYLPDRSGNGRAAGPEVSNVNGSGLCNPPTFLNSGIGSKPTLVFDGTKAMGLTLDLPQLYTIIAVALTTGAAAQQILGADDTTSTPTKRAWQFGYASTGTPLTVSAFNTSSSAFAGTQTVGSPTAGAVLSAVRGASSVQAFVNGVAGSSTSTTGTPNTATAVPLALGARRVNNTMSGFLTGQIARILVFTGALSSTERHNIELALGTIYGISVS